MGRPGRVALASSRRRRELLTPLVAVVCILGGTISAIAAPATSSAASVGGDHSQISQIEHRIAADGARIQKLVLRYDHAQARAASLKVSLKATRAHLAADRQAQARAAGELRTVAVQAYVSDGGMASPTLLSGSASTRGMASVYVDVAGQRLRGAIDTFQYTQHEALATAATLTSEEQAAEATMRALAPDQRAAQAAVVADNALLARVKGNLHSLLVAAAARRERAHLAAERRMAARAAAAVAASEAPATPAPSPAAASNAPAASTSAAPAAVVPTPTPTPPPVAPSPAPGGYADPLRAVGGLSPERIDQGVDYGGYGPIYALGDGVVESTVNGGWPGGTFISYRLTDGPAAGLVVYAAEDIDPLVQVGQTVTASTELGLVYAGPDGIETGWAAPGGLGDTMAAQGGQFAGGNTTAYGANFSQLLQVLGAPGGIPQNVPPTGYLPSGWPSW